MVYWLYVIHFADSFQIPFSFMFYLRMSKFVYPVDFNSNNILITHLLSIERPGFVKLHDMFQHKVPQSNEINFRLAAVLFIIHKPFHDVVGRIENSCAIETCIANVWKNFVLCSLSHPWHNELVTL